MMNPRQRRELDELLAADADGLLDDAGAARLADLLREHPDARRAYFDHIELHAALHWEYADAATDQVVPAKARKRWVLPLAAAAALILGFVLWVGNRPTEPLARVVSAEGAVSWAGAGESRSGLTAAAALSSGTLTLEGETSFAEIRFNDGTTMTFSGETDATLAADRFGLRRGDIGAAVDHQSDPLRIITSAVELEITDAVLTLSVRDHDSHLAVHEGRVRLRRTIDGSTVEVGAGEQVTATLDVNDPLLASEPESAPVIWSSEIGRGTRVSCGSLDSSVSPPVVRSAPYIVRRKADGSVVTRNGVGLRSDDPARRGLVRFEPGTIVTLRYRSDWGPQIFVSTHHPDGSFGGNFTVELHRFEGVEDADGFKRIDVPVEAFEPHPRAAERHPSIFGKSASLFLISSSAKHPRLEVGSISVRPGNLP